MKKIFKSRIFFLILGMIITTTIGVTASVIYNSSEIGFTPSDTNWKVNNLEDAINDLYKMGNNVYVLGSIGTFSNGTNSYGSSSAYTSDEEYMTTTYDNNHVYINILKDMEISFILCKTSRGNAVTYTNIEINGSNVSKTTQKNKLDTYDTIVSAGDTIDVYVGYGDNTNSVGFLVYKK